MKFIRHLTLLGLLIFCGQTLAASFLDCCAAMLQVPDESQHDACGELSIQTHGEYMGVDLENAHSMSMPMSMDSGEHECDHQCDFCLMPLIIIQDYKNTQQSFQAENKFHYDLLLLTKSLETPLRPPISA